MRASIVMVVLEGGAGGRLIEVVGTAPAVGAAEYRSSLSDRVVLLEAEDARAAATVADAIGARPDVVAVRALQEVYRMGRGSSGEAVQIASSSALDTVADHLMSVVLPVPPGRRDEWNRWYDEHHMPAVLALEPGVTTGHRFAPVRPSDEDAHLVLYEFPTEAALDGFATGAVPAAKKTEYFDRWGVRNERRSLDVVERWAPQHGGAST